MVIHGLCWMRGKGNATRFTFGMAKTATMNTVSSQLDQMAEKLWKNVEEAAKEFGHTRRNWYGKGESSPPSDIPVKAWAKRDEPGYLQWAF
jgi:hypothetical protein